MDYAHRYGDPRRLYLNVTNRCTNRCAFCIRCHTRGLGGAILMDGPDPDLDTLEDAVLGLGALRDFDEFVWCGFGEPTFRIDLIREASGWLRGSGAKVRLNTNGHAALIHGRDVLPELGAAVDRVSVSLNAPDRRRYVELCRPDPGSMSAGGRLSPADFWRATLDFCARSPEFFEQVQASVVGSALSAEEAEQARSLARSFGITLFRVR